MTYTTNLSTLKAQIARTFFANEGDQTESSYWTYFKERFPACETYWRYFIVPMTNRIDPAVTTSAARLPIREGVSDDLIDIAGLHYSMFLHLVYAYNHLQNFGPCSFDDFYTHLGSACDLAEDFLIKNYLVTLQCTGGKTQILQQHTEAEFLKIAQDWYAEHYSKVYEHYLTKGKPPPMKIPGRNSVLDEYFVASPDWRKYKRFTQKIREYRNVIAHNATIAKLITPRDNIVLVPKKERILKYKRWQDVFDANHSLDKLRSDFINMIEQMVLDIGTLETSFNPLWCKPIFQLNRLLYREKNTALLQKYNLSFT